MAWNRERHVPLHPQRLSILQVRKLRHGARVTATPTQLPGQSCLHSVQRHEALLTASCPLGGRSLDFPFLRTKTAASVTPAPSSHGPGIWAARWLRARKSRWHGTAAPLLTPCQGAAVRSPSPAGCGFGDRCSLCYRTDLRCKVAPTSRVQGACINDPTCAMNCAG